MAYKINTIQLGSLPVILVNFWVDRIDAHPEKALTKNNLALKHWLWKKRRKKKQTDTLPETKIAPENRWLEY